MAVCVGCGLEVNSGILEVALCPNGGIECATEADPSPGGCTSGLYIQFPANEEGGSSLVPIGCGLSTDGNGDIQVNACEGGGISCGTLGGDVNCIYTNVQGDDGIQGQTDEACLPLAQVDTTGGGAEGSDAGPHINHVAFPNGTPDPGSANLSPSCNGLVRSCEGLWAPPKVPSINFNCGQIETGNPVNFPGTPINEILFPLNNQDFAGQTQAGEEAYGSSAARIQIFNTFTGDECLPIDAMSFTAFNISMLVRGGERWKFTLWERITVAPATLNDGDSGTAGWVAQATFFLDRVGNGADGYESVVFNDISTWDFAAGAVNYRMEAMITVVRLIGTDPAPFTNPVISTNFQYRNMGHGYHRSVPKNCGALGLP